MTSSDIEIQIFTEKLTDHFSILPNEMQRGEGEWYGMTARARQILGALLTFQSGWRMSRGRVDKLAPELGRYAMDTVLKELKTRRHLFVRRINAGSGRFTWQWRVFLRPVPEGVDVWADDPRAPGRTIAQSSSNGSDQGEHGVSAGRTIAQSSGDGWLGGYKKEPSREVTTEEETREASLGSPEARPAPALPRRRLPSTKPRDPLIKDQNADDAEARSIATADDILDDDDADRVIRYLRRDRNASTTAGHLRHIDDLDGLAEIHGAALAWEFDLNETRRNVAHNLTTRWGLDATAADRIAGEVRDCLEIRVPIEQVEERLSAVRRSPSPSLDAYLRALGELRGEREIERRQERIDRVRRQQAGI